VFQKTGFQKNEMAQKKMKNPSKTA